MLLLSKEDIRQLFSMREAIEADKQAFMMFSQGKVNVPLRTQISAENHNGTFVFMPAYAAELEAASLKIVSVFPENVNNGLASTPAQVLLINGKNGFIEAILDGTMITQMRTGAASGVAFDVLGRKEAKAGALIGTGGQAAAQLEAMICARDLEIVRVYDTDFARLQNFTTSMQQELAAYQTKIIAAKSSNEAIAGADLIATVTPSKKPVFDGSKVKAGATISCVGSYQPDMQEMDSVILERSAKIYFDSEEAVLSEAGDILIPLEQGIITKQDFTGDIGKVLLGNLPGREDEQEIIVFKTVGLGVQDLVTAKTIFDKAKYSTIGTHWE